MPNSDKTREMIISGYCDHALVNELFKPLLGKFVDELNKEEKLLLELSHERCEGDLWFAIWNPETGRLTCAAGADCGTVTVEVSPRMKPQAALDALYALMGAAGDFDSYEPAPPRADRLIDFSADELAGALHEIEGHDFSFEDEHEQFAWNELRLMVIRVARQRRENDKGAR